MVKNFEVVPNIRTASISKDLGLIALELEGAGGEIERVCDWLKGLGVTIEPLEKNVIE